MTPPTKKPANRPDGPGLPSEEGQEKSKHASEFDVTEAHAAPAA